jgi:hypothetical protein
MNCNWLHACCYSDLMYVSVACWKAGEMAFDRSENARRQTTAKLRRDVTADVATIESANVDRPPGDLLDQIDFEASADHWLARFNGYRRRHRAAL